MGASIRDVAVAAGVSPTTVSQALNDQGRVAPETRRRIQSIAAELGYHANVHAQQLVTRRSRTIAIQVGRLSDGERALVPHSEYFLEVLNGAAARAAELGYIVVLVPPGMAVAALDAFGVDSAIIVDPVGDEPLFQSKLGLGGRVVTMGRPKRDMHGVCMVDSDHRLVAQQMMDHLASRGYRTPVVVVEDDERSYLRDLVAGYTDWCAVRGLEPVVLHTMVEGRPMSPSEVIDCVLESCPTVDAVYAGTEELALDLLGEAARRGLRIPSDLAIASAVDSVALRRSTPRVTGVFLHPFELGQRAAELAVGVTESTHQVLGDAPRIIVAADLIARDST